MTDQVLLSATNFVTGMLLARFAAPGTYGAYALAFGTLLVLQGIQSALITSPLTILGAPREGDDLRRFVSALAIAQVALGLGMSALCLLFSGVGIGLAPGAEVPRVFLAMGAASFFVQSQEFCRRVLYARLLPGRALLNDVVFCCLQLGGVSALWLLDRHHAGGAEPWLCGRNVFFAMGISALAGTLTGIIQARSFFLPGKPNGLRGLLAEAWEMGRFGLGAQAGQAMFLLANRLAAAGAGGTIGVAMLEAPRLLVAPLQIIGASAGTLSAPRAARAYASGGKRALLRFLSPIAAVWAAAFVGYAAIIAAAPGFWLRAFYGQKYSGAETILVLWCLTYALIGLRVLPQSALRVTRNYSVTMWASLAGGGVVVVVSGVFAAWLGVPGAAIGRLVGEVVLMTVLVTGFIKRVRPWSEST